MLNNWWKDLQFLEKFCVKEFGLPILFQKVYMVLLTISFSFNMKDFFAFLKWKKCKIDICIFEMNKKFISFNLGWNKKIIHQKFCQKYLSQNINKIIHQKFHQKYLLPQNVRLIHYPSNIFSFVRNI